ncbi:SIR2 family protein [Methanococcoides alaskense]|uniref:SIR2-like domain-containing protein n=1 Tax=Methanococcoides alaskense TaxID=325778 RepID=A0AA90U1U8_9EURY|nr:SIR2 family protein [Methanococcoides alaskense]MDA0524266.1 SIR2 family protein [Methanococcoides alaskense]MDR6223783.1 hypothetical protein [Methanococcoides alaskense]
MDISIKDTLVAHFQQISSSPFLFVGSGFSRRYIGLEKWDELLKSFCKGLKPYEYYVSKSDGSLESTATLISEDFNDLWWESPEYERSRKENTADVIGNASALKFSIAKYVKDLSTNDIEDPDLKKEIELLLDSNIDGIITTNWDLLLETLFPKYKVYVGQKELISSSPLSIAEIYKIHGCSSNPNSMVLTAEDYEAFNERNTYLAAKLITLFVEHPIIFIGYSLNDPNVVALLHSVVKCLTQEGIDKVRKNLIFVQRLKAGRTEGISDSIMTFPDGHIPIKLVTTNSFIPVYEAIASVERKIPASILRHCKDQFYTLVKENDPHGHLSVVDYDLIDDENDIEFFAGIGVVSDKVSTLGYTSITAEDLFLDWINDSNLYDSTLIIEKTLPELRKGRSYLPIYKYLQDMGISSQADYEMSGLNFDTLLAEDHMKYQSNSLKRSYELHADGKTFHKILDEFTFSKACGYIPLLSLSEIDLPILEDFISINQYLLNDSSYKTYYRKSICLADYLKYGWDNVPADE